MMNGPAVRELGLQEHVFDAMGLDLTVDEFLVMIDMLNAIELGARKAIKDVKDPD